MSGERPIVGVGVVIRDPNGRILLIERGHEPAKGLWAVPGGKVRWKETLKTAAQREAFEETGLEVEVGEVIWIGENTGDDYHIVLIDYSATVVGGTLQAGDDAADVRWVTIDEARQLPLTASMHQMLDTLEP